MGAAGAGRHHPPQRAGAQGSAAAKQQDSCGGGQQSRRAAFAEQFPHPGAGQCATGPGADEQAQPQALFKKSGYSWKRFRKWLKSKPTAQELSEKVAALKALVKLGKAGLIDLLFGDESGFSLTPYVPYGWQPVGEQVGIPTKREHLCNVLGLLDPIGGKLVAYSAAEREKVNSAFMVSRLDDFAQSLGKETVVVLDNAPWHKSKKFMGQIERWQEKGLFIFHLPRYSPHLNLIETLWRKIKYEWFRPADYTSGTALKKRLKEIFSCFGEQFKINFSLQCYT